MHAQEAPRSRLSAEDSKKVAAFLGISATSTSHPPKVPSAAALGQEFGSELGNVCEQGIHEPKEFGPNEQFSATLIGVLAYADKTYVLCTDRCDMPIPPELDGKVLMVNGYEIDQCLQLQDRSHWLKATLTHGAAIAHAKANGLDRAAVLEEDTTSAPSTYVWQPTDFQAINAFLEGDDRDSWNVIRLGYRPVAHEGPEDRACEPECQCEAVGGVLCYMRAAGCQLHSSDAYIIRASMFDWALRSVAVGTIIDFGLLQSIPGQLVITPQINYQTGYFDMNDFTDLPTQLRAGAAFQKSCMPAPQATATSGSSK